MIKIILMIKTIANKYQNKSPQSSLNKPLEIRTKALINKMHQKCTKRESELNKLNQAKMKTNNEIKQPHLNENIFHTSTQSSKI